MVVLVLQGLLTFGYITLLSTVGENLAVRMRQRLFAAYLSQDITFFDTHKTGELVDRLVPQTMCVLLITNKRPPVF